MEANGWVRASTAGPSEDTASLSAGWPAHREPEGGGIWRLQLGVETISAEDAVMPGVAMEDLPLFLQKLGPLPDSARALLLPDFHRAFPSRASSRAESGTPPAIATPAYLLARLSQLGAGSRLLIASAREEELLRRAPDLLGGRGAACQFTVKREPGPPLAPAGIRGPGDRDLENAGSAAELRRIALHAPDGEIRARAAAAAIRAEPEDACGQLLAGCAANERRRPAEAADAFRRAIERDGSLAAAHFELGKTQIVLDDLEGALDAFLAATRALPEFASAWANAGAALGELERADEALEPLKQAVALDPLNHSFLSNLGVTLRDLGRLPEAEAAFGNVLDLAPDFVFGKYNLANVVFLMGRHREAVDLFEEARSRDSSRSARQGLLLAAARLGAGDEERALAAYREVFESLSGQMRKDMRTVAEWDLKGLARREGVTPGLRRAVELVRSVQA